jgi:hypothetical protein
MADPQSPVGQIESGNEESESNGSLGLYESKRKRSSDPHNKDYVPEEEVYEH